MFHKTTGLFRVVGGGSIISPTPSVVRWTSTDAISELYVANIRSTFAKMKETGGITASSAEAKKQLDDQLNRLAKHGLTSVDQINKLNFKPKPADIESSVGALLEGGKTTTQLMTELDISQKLYEREHAVRVAEEKQKESVSSGAFIPEKPEWKDDPDFDYRYWNMGETDPKMIPRSSK